MVSEFVIEDNIPLPRKGMAGRWDFLRQMTKGQSFVVRGKHYGAVRAFAHRHGIKITTRKINPTEIRVWKRSDKNEQ